MSTLHAWLEFTDTQTGSPRRVDLDEKALSVGRTGGDLRLPDPELSEIHMILTREREVFVLRDLGSRNGTFVNSRPIVEAELNDLDQIRIGQTTFVFHLAYLERGLRPLADRHPYAAELAAPGRQLANAPGRQLLNPIAMFMHPLRFWPQALAASVFEFRRTWLVYLLSLAVVIAGAFLIGSGVPLLHLGFLFFASTLANALMAITCSVFFAFDSLTDAPHRLSQAVRFIFCMSPFLLADQIVFLTWASHAHPKANHYFMAAAIPTFVLWILVGAQSRFAFAATLPRGLAFAVTASVPWNLFMTGLMSFVV